MKTISIKTNISASCYSFMAEAGIEIFIAAAVALGIVTAIQFAERAYRYKRMREQKTAGTMGFEYEPTKKEKREGAV
jgi:hypothetical protein